MMEKEITTVDFKKVIVDFCLYDGVQPEPKTINNFNWEGKIIEKESAKQNT